MKLATPLMIRTALLFLHSYTQASTIEEIIIETSTADDNSEKISSELALPSAKGNDFQLDGQNRIEAVSDVLFDDLSNEKDILPDERGSNVADIGHYCRKKIAFSAYLSATTKLGARQHIRFDKVLLNDGNGYERSTGVFRAPVSGVYSFTFVIGQQHQQELRTNLVVDGKLIVGAIAEGSKTYHNAQGTNTVNIHVSKGKAVWVETVWSGSVEGDSVWYRDTSFSGHILYERV